MTQTFKALALLLTYPTAELCAAAAELREAIEREALLSTRDRKGVLALIDEVATRNLYDLQERYVLLFDRSKSLSLHLFEHVHGESRDRGQAMVDLMSLYERHGLRIEARELPDYLPLFLEFLSTLPLADARALLAEPLHVITALRERLRKRKSSYTAVFRALEALASSKAEPSLVAELLDGKDDDPNDLDALDAEWEEAAVTFGPGAAVNGEDGACPASRDMLARMDRPVSKTASEKGARHG